MARDKTMQSRLYKEWYEANREYALAKMRARAASPVGVVDRHKRTLKRHGITDADWASAMTAQDGKCAGMTVTRLQLRCETTADFPVVPSRYPAYPLVMSPRYRQDQRTTFQREVRS